MTSSYRLLDQAPLSCWMLGLSVCGGGGGDASPAADAGAQPGVTGAVAPANQADPPATPLQETPTNPPAIALDARGLPQRRPPPPASTTAVPTTARSTGSLAIRTGRWLVNR